MLAFPSGNKLRDVPLGDTKLLPKRGLGDAASRIAPPYFGNLDIRQSGVPIVLAANEHAAFRVPVRPMFRATPNNDAGESPFGDGIRSIVDVRSHGQVCRVTARRVVANQVANHSAFGYRAVGQLPRHPVSPFQLTTNPDPAIPLRISMRHEWPARIGSTRSVHLFPEPFRWRAGLRRKEASAGAVASIASGNLVRCRPENGSASATGHHDRSSPNIRTHRRSLLVWPDQAVRSVVTTSIAR